jgi:hypothetical protein
MYMLSAAQLLDFWEWGSQRPLALRGLGLLAAALPEMSYEALSRLSIGQRDSHLLSLREWAFGSQVACTAVCPQCGERLELSFLVSDIRQEALQALESGGESNGALTLEAAGFRVRFRLPDSQDLLAIAGLPSAGQAQILLLERCVLEAWQDETPIRAADLPQEVVDAIEVGMARADPQAEVLLSLVCPACQRQWQAIFDILAFFWSEIGPWAIRLLDEVNTLAYAYGWREADILALSPWRRQAYLERVGG